MDIEEPPSKHGYTFYGSDRIGSSGYKSSGGTEILLKSDIGDVN